PVRNPVVSVGQSKGLLVNDLPVFARQHLAGKLIRSRERFNELVNLFSFVGLRHGRRRKQKESPDEEDNLSHLETSFTKMREPVADRHCSLIVIDGSRMRLDRKEPAGTRLARSENAAKLTRGHAGDAFERAGEMGLVRKPCGQCDLDERISRFKHLPAREIDTSGAHIVADGAAFKLPEYTRQVGGVNTGGRGN